MLLRGVATLLRDCYADESGWPWVIGYSGGKDSTLVLQLVLTMLLDAPATSRTREVYVVTNDTLVESPVIARHVKRQLVALRAWLAIQERQQNKLPVEVIETFPEPDVTFWFLLIGKGYPPPRRRFRWCTDRLKVRATARVMRDIVDRCNGVTVLLGSRRAESDDRARGIDRRAGAGPYGSTGMKGQRSLLPIVNLVDDEVWQVLLQQPPPWGGNHRDLWTLYRNAVGECPFVLSKDDSPACGGASPRMGCWTCTVVAEDKSLQAQALNDEDEALEGLLAFRSWLSAFGEDHRNRRGARRNGKPGKGGFTLVARRTILRKLLRLQRDVGFPLISGDEIGRIRRQWAADRDALNGASEPLCSALVGGDDEEPTEDERQLALFDLGGASCRAD